MKVLKWVAIVLGGLVTVIVLVALVLGVRGSRLLERPAGHPYPSVTAAADSASVARGRHLVTAIMPCIACHGQDLGGDVMIESGFFGTVTAPNLTSGKGGLGGQLTDAAIARSIRHAVDSAGEPLVIMPFFPNLSDRDLAALVAYIRALPPVDRELPATAVGPAVKVMIGTGAVPLLEALLPGHDEQPEPDGQPVADASHGRYIARIAYCSFCHGKDLNGGISGAGQSRPSSNITPEGLKGWTEDDFIRAMRTGIRPNKTPIDTTMPWRQYAGMDTTELRALWQYLQTVPAKPYRQ